MAKPAIHHQRSRSWWNGTVTMLCGATFPRSELERLWMTWNGPTCPTCRRLKRH